MNKIYLEDPPRLKRLMQSWFLHYFRKTADTITGYETYTLFDSLASFKQNNILLNLGLLPGELPILILTVDESTSIINTTSRFIRLCVKEVTTVMYHDFLSHIGYRSMYTVAPQSSSPVNIKKDGLFDDFGIKLKTGEIVWWRIPTGNPGFGFWNVTKRCGVD